jgi:hypothetical protein
MGMSTAHTATLKIFKRTKSLEEIRQQCKVAGVDLDTRLFDDGADHVTLRSTDGKRGAVVIFNAFNGRFFGTTPDGTQFSSDDKRDGTPWFDALLEFFYSDKATAAQGE